MQLIIEHGGDFISVEEIITRLYDEGLITNGELGEYTRTFESFCNRTAQLEAQCSPN